MPTLVMRNNIVDGLREMNGDVSHQLYTTYAPSNSINIDTTHSRLDIRGMNNFTDWSTGDWTLKNGAWAIDAGIDVGVTTDVNGNARPYGNGPDIGCYEWQGTGIDWPENGNLEIGGLVIPNPVRALAGAIIIKKAIIQDAKGTVRLFTMIGKPITNLTGLGTGFYLLKTEKRMQRILIVE